jgi:nicotinamide-nucleotide amidase
VAEQAVTSPDPEPPAEQIVTLLTGRGQTVAVAESLTGGLLAAALVEVPGASAVFRGGIVAYATDLKSALLDVPASLLERYGAVHADVAGAMAGPDPADGQPVGTVHIAASGQVSTVRRRLSLAGGRRSIRDQAVLRSLLLLQGMLEAGGT